MKIAMMQEAGQFGENKDIARRLRIKEIMPALLDGDEVILDTVFYSCSNCGTDTRIWRCVF